MKENNLFQYATKELSQDAMLCWMINWLNYPQSDLYSLGKDVLDLFLGQNKQEKYYNVEVKRQYKKIDVLILFNDQYAMIIEDKTNTSEHGEQIARYKELLQKDYPNRTIYTAYIKTGIMYDEDYMMIKKTDQVVTLEMLLPILFSTPALESSEILLDYVQYLSSIAEERKNIDEMIVHGKLNEAFKNAYGQFSFLNHVFTDRTKGTPLGKTYKDKEKNPVIFSDTIYAGSNNDGSPWTQYCFWGKKYEEQLQTSDRIEYHYLFWRIDRFWDTESDQWKYYIALRHYDEHTKKSEDTKIRKAKAYDKLRKECDKYSSENGGDLYYHSSIFKEIGVRVNYNESDLLYIPVEKLSEEFNYDYKKMAEYLRTITNDIKAKADKLVSII